MPIPIPKSWSVGISIIYSLCAYYLCSPNWAAFSHGSHLCTCLPPFWKTSFPYHCRLIFWLFNHISMLGWAKCPCFVLPQSHLLLSMLGLICSFIPHLYVESLQCVGCYGHGSELERQNPCQMGSGILQGRRWYWKRDLSDEKKQPQDYVDKRCFRQMAKQVQRPWRVKELVLFEEQ